MKYIIKCNGFYLSYILVDSRFPETDFIKSILFVTEGNGALSFGDIEEAKMFANKIYINLGLKCEIVEDEDE